ncbi:MAG TPA: lysophospholipid acyltransferase family protein [Chitinophagaceae bacterium]
MFALISYYIALPFIYLLSLLPFRVLYIISDGFFFVIYHVVGYRKKVVLANLRNSFPEKTEQEIRVICRSFYKYFCDLFLETFKTLTISPAAMLKHCVLEPAATKLFNDFAAENKSLIIVMGHKGNWEWAGNTFSLCCKQQLYVIYHPLSHPYFNKLVVKMRTRFGTKLIAMKDTFRDMLQKRDELNATAFIADQAPLPDKAWWMSFLNQDTPVFMGTEKIAQKMKYPIVYVCVKKIKRGYYTLTADTLKMPPYLANEGEITEAHTKRLEKDIREQPETWLWTHRRWKHKRA